MALRDDHRVALNRLTWLPVHEANRLRYKAMSQATDEQIEAMALDLQDMDNVGRQTALEILFAVALCLNENGEEG